mmetsp:Transcript_86535/g.253324  ORF Transcript_86535/g.253324 Transcript_86535/m.253324 type:complete len:239 (+) Transcript_86535:86-802(+)
MGASESKSYPESGSRSQSPEMLTSCIPHRGLHPIFWDEQLVRQREWRASWPWRACNSGSSACSGEFVEEVHSETVQRIEHVSRVYWCSEPLNEAGPFKFLSPRSLQRYLAFRGARKLAGPASWEAGHSYAVVDVVLSATPGAAERSERYRLNWGQGKKHGTNLSMIKHQEVPPRRIMDERLENSWPGTCSGEELYVLLQRWDGRQYDAAPSNNRNCHHFVQELIQQCTPERGYGHGDR